MSNRDRAFEVLSETIFHCPDHEEFGLNDKHAMAVADALIAAGLIHVGQRFCTKVANCRMADGHAGGCERT